MINLFSKNNSGLEFYCEEALYNVIPEPLPSNKLIPEWFKKIKPFSSERSADGSPSMTAKKCLPMLDAMSIGYIIRLPADLYVLTNHDLSIIKVNVKEGCNYYSVANHDYSQIKSDSWPKNLKQNPLKFLNLWWIKTNPGWSCYFTSPINEIDAPFECLSGVVDTDSYDGLINFPAIWKEPNFDGWIPAGTPLVTVIPFKRNDLKLNAKIRKITKNELLNFNNLRKKQDGRHHVYTHELREDRK